jgi:hypothetical protein
MKDEQSIERLLRSAQPSTPAPGGIGSCLDAETLAAWIDGGLKSKQLRQAELHVSSCARCQAAVAATMTSAPLVTSSEAETPAGSWSLRWFVPLAAGLTAVGLWFMVPSRSPLETPASESSQAALERQIPAAPVEQPGPPAPSRDERAPQSSLGKLADAAPLAEERKDQMTAAGARPKPLNEGTADEGAVRTRQEAETDSSAKGATDRADAVREELSARAVAPSPSAPAAAGAAAPSAPRAARSAASTDRSANVQIAGAEAAGIDVVSPNPSIRWRLGSGGFIQYSSDAGATWIQQRVAVAVDLLAGSSPSGDVCWVVGRAGTVLRTVDGGQRWERVTAAGSLDLKSVTASDASTAQVTAADGRVFRTVDAGNTWR